MPRVQAGDGLDDAGPGVDTADGVGPLAGYVDVAAVIDRDAAWSRNAREDRVFVAAMIRGSTLVLKGKSKNNINTADTYSLKGFTKSYRAISKACGL